MLKIIRTEYFEHDGYTYIREYYNNGTIVESLKPEGAESIPTFTKPNQPTNAEVIQAISDLQADLIIAGVLQ